MHPLAQREFMVLQVRGWAKAGRLYAIVDACDTPSVPRRAAALDPSTAVSLYKGRAEENLSAIAPYLFQVDETIYDWFTRDLWSTPWGFFILSDEPLESLRTHFRKFLMVESPEGESWYFRFYDPRVLRKYLASSTPKELTAFFGPARALGWTDPETYAVTVATLNGPESTAPRTQPVIVRR
jgi:hypothetical protein